MIAKCSTTQKLDFLRNRQLLLHIIRVEDNPARVLHFVSRPLQNASFCPISVSGSNFNPQNTQCIRACPVGPEDRTGVDKIFAFLELEQK